MTLSNLARAATTLVALSTISPAPLRAASQETAIKYAHSQMLDQSSQIIGAEWRANAFFDNFYLGLSANTVVNQISYEDDYGTHDASFYDIGSLVEYRIRTGFSLIPVVSLNPSIGRIGFRSTDTKEYSSSSVHILRISAGLSYYISERLKIDGLISQRYARVAGNGTNASDHDLRGLELVLGLSTPI